MPSFPFFKRQSEGKNGTSDAAGDGIVDSKNASAPEKTLMQRRQSKRQFFRSLLPGAGAKERSKSQASNRSQVKSPIQPTSPTKSIPDANKPLPAPPPQASSSSGPEPTAPKQLNRIITPLSVQDVHKLFSGAPQFFVRSEGSHTGAPNPSVAFPWNKELQIRDLSDYGQIEDQAWSTVTAKQHITRDGLGTPGMGTKEKKEARERHEKLRAHYAPKCHERPNMLSMQGLERGTIGFAAAMELGVKDALQVEEEPSNSGNQSLAQRRLKFLKEKRGVRPMDDSTLISRLVDICEKNDLPDQSLGSAVKSSVDLYSELFSQVLYPPTRVTDSNDPYSLFVQVEALLEVLGTPHIWIDFSLVEWRIRLGQILWSDEPYEPEEPVEINSEIYDSGSQQFWLLLQIMLSCELLIRLDIITKKAEKDPNIITGEEIQRFERDATPNVRWSMILARVWLENIYVDEKLTQTEDANPVAAGWLATLTGTAATPKVDAHKRLNPACLKVKHPIRQSEGLIHFAKKLHWPGAEILASKFSHLHSTSDGSTDTGSPPVETPFSMTTRRSSYFVGANEKSVMRRNLSAKNLNSVKGAEIKHEGWLSRSYLSGLILPGEGLYHFLIATLLENDNNAIARLGENANLYGGFVYMKKSFWSTECMVGRVLAAGKGASECMGWLSSDIIPKGRGEGWVNVEVDLEPSRDGKAKNPASARIWKKAEVEKESRPLGDGDVATALSGDFSVPVHDVLDSSNLEVKFVSLELFASLDGATPEADDGAIDLKATPLSDTSNLSQDIKNYAATMKFEVKYKDGTKDMSFELEHDVSYVTAHPCVPSKHHILLNSPTSPPISPTAKGADHLSAHSIEDGAIRGPHDKFPGHPLHKSYHYQRELFSNILFPSLIRKDSISQHPLQSLHTSSDTVFVIDCTEPAPPAPTPLMSPQNPSSAAGPLDSNLDLGSSTLSTGALPSGVSEPAASVLGRVHVTRKRKFGSDLEMMARAWCAENGYNALISRKGRNCIACSIREARALGWKVILRFG